MKLRGYVLLMGHQIVVKIRTRSSKLSRNLLRGSLTHFVIKNTERTSPVVFICILSIFDFLLLLVLQTRE